MFVKSNMDVAVTYNKGEHSIVLEPHVITEVDENIVSKQELKNCYSERITFIDPKYIGEEVEPPVIGEMDKDETPDNNSNQTEDSGDETEANTGDAEVDAFLNGEMDILPEGTVEISEKEAEELAKKEQIAEKCQPCYADGKTPSKEDCLNCKVGEEANENQVPVGEKKEDKPSAKEKPAKKPATKSKTKKGNK